MKNIVDYIIYEMSRNEKRRITDVAQGLFKNKVAKHGHNHFGILTAENPNSEKISAQENKKRMTELRKMLKKSGHLFVNIDGKFDGNLEHSLIIFDIDLNELKYLSGKFEQTSFFYCYKENKTIMSEYWEKETNGKPYDEKENPYKLINKTDVYHEVDKNANDNFSIIGGKFKYTIDASVFGEE